MPLFVEIPFQKLCEIDTLAKRHLQILFLRLRLVTRFPALTAGCMLPRAFQK